MTGAIISAILQECSSIHVHENRVNPYLVKPYLYWRSCSLSSEIGQEEDPADLDYRALEEKAKSLFPGLDNDDDQESLAHGPDREGACKEEGSS